MKLLSLAAVLALTTAAPAFAQVMSPDEYVKTAGSSDLYERQSSQLVLETTVDPKVKAFAAMMVEDHGKSTAKVAAAAEASGIVAGPPMLTPTQTELIAELQALAGSERDARYIAEQKAAHGQALAVQEAYAMDGTAPKLRSAASGIVPVVKHHIKMLKAM